jgi:integrase
MNEERVHVWVQNFPDRRYLVLQWVDPETGARKSKSARTDDPDEAETVRADLEYELNNGRYQEASRMTWERFRELFEAEHLPGLRPKTRRAYQNVLNSFERVCRPSRLKKISERTISLFVSGLRNMKVHGRVGMQPSSIHVRLRFLHGALSWAVDQKLIPYCPKFPYVKVPKKKPQPVATESFERLLSKASDENMRVFLLCGWLAGLRLEEAFRLEWEPTDLAPYVDFLADRIILPAAFVKAVEDQWVPLDPSLRQALEKLPRIGPRVFGFVNERGKADQPVTADAISQRIIRLARRAGVKLTMRTLRRGFGCRYAGHVPAQVLQRLMRHSNIAITMDYYANVDAAVEEAVLGHQRNSSRNTSRHPQLVQKPAVAVSPS